MCWNSSVLYSREQEDLDPLPSVYLYHLTLQDLTMSVAGDQVEIISFATGNVLLAATFVGLIYKTRNLIPKVG